MDAPGANDNGSGTALTMELARVFAESGLEFDATLAFVLWAGEEQGLIGSRAHAMRVVRRTRCLVDADFNNDIVGNSRGGDGTTDAESVRVYSEGPRTRCRGRWRATSRASRPLYVPSHQVRLIARQDRFSRGSDHTSFTQHGFPAVAFRESKEDFSRQHAATDTVDGVDVRVSGAERARERGRRRVARARASGAARDESERSGDARQAAVRVRRESAVESPAPGAAAYRLYWREAWAPDWQQSQLVGDVTEFCCRRASRSTTWRSASQPSARTATRVWSRLRARHPAASTRTRAPKPRHPSPDVKGPLTMPTTH